MAEITTELLELDLTPPCPNDPEIALGDLYLEWCEARAAADQAASAAHAAELAAQATVEWQTFRQRVDESCAALAIAGTLDARIEDVARLLYSGSPTYRHLLPGISFRVDRVARITDPAAALTYARSHAGEIPGILVPETFNEKLLAKHARAVEKTGALPFVKFEEKVSVNVKAPEYED
jgi:hypothetical protein